MSSIKRVFIIVLDSVGIGEMPDAADFGDVGSHTVRACFNTGKLNVPEMSKLGLFNISGIGCGESVKNPAGAYAKMTEASKGKDTTIGHWEIAGIISEKPMPTCPNGFPDEIIKQFENVTGRKVLCNKPYSGTKVIADYGREHMETGALIVYTSADSVFQIAAHEDIVPIEKLYEYCEAARKMLTGDYAIGRVIARPFTGSYPDFERTSRRHDFSLMPPKDTALDYIKNAGLDVLGIGKIYDIFAGKGITSSQRTVSNDDGMTKTLEHAKQDFHGLCFVNLVDFDMKYGHRNDVNGYTEALNRFDQQLAELLTLLKEDDVLMITADHGCDPTTPSTDHSREYTPLLIYGNRVNCKDFGIRNTFADIGATTADLLGIKAVTDGKSLMSEGLLKE
jgi:phosphopentomutase